ncbi:hypothetical protein NVP1170O_069 [Vibrio phage 1.170.O._10N.261.52.C3]|nr:hypothetical protein NVP1170O_069 [Vibrio phage 1.170.O._10N.261.52.C3]
MSSVLTKVLSRNKEGHNFTVVPRKEYENQKSDIGFNYGHFHYKIGDRSCTCLFW